MRYGGNEESGSSSSEEVSGDGGVSSPDGAEAAASDGAEAAATDGAAAPIATATWCSIAARSSCDAAAADEAALGLEPNRAAAADEAATGHDAAPAEAEAACGVGRVFGTVGGVRGAGKFLGEKISRGTAGVQEDSKLGACDTRTYTRTYVR